MNRLVKNCKGVAEIIGTVMFIVILLFFFTNVYLWHDAATKEMNNLTVEKINSPIALSLMNSPYALNVTNKGGEDATLSMLWINIKSTSPNGGPDQLHLNFTLNTVVPAGGSLNITLGTTKINYLPGANPVQFKVVTSVGNSAACNYSPP